MDSILDKRFLSRSIGLLHLPEPTVIPHYASLREALTALQLEKYGAIIVTGESGKVSGIFTERDAVKKVILQECSLDETPISQLMTAEPMTAQMQTTVAYALNMMSHGGFRHIPVVDDEGFPVGIITVKQLVDYISQAITREILP